MRAMTLALTLAAALAGCATTRQLDSDVSTYSQWPAGRQPATYAFERLPSQQARAEQQQMLEDAARPAVEAAGFKPAADDKGADVSIQVGARVSATQRVLYDDPFWWRGGLYGHWRRGFYSPYWGVHYATPFYDREVALLIRDRKSGLALYEARATNGASSAAIGAVLPAMFEAAMKDFPHAGVNPRRVTVELNR
jgi:Domain of unknown function (DUF4136)